MEWRPHINGLPVITNTRKALQKQTKLTISLDYFKTHNIDIKYLDTEVMTNALKTFYNPDHKAYISRFMYGRLPSPEKLNVNCGKFTSEPHTLCPACNQLYTHTKHTYNWHAIGQCTHPKMIKIRREWVNGIRATINTCIKDTHTNNILKCTYCITNSGELPQWTNEQELRDRLLNHTLYAQHATNYTRTLSTRTTGTP
jgi:hypothetical protein